jgi:hypothetical protein
MAFRFNQGDRPLPGYTIQRGVGRGGFGEVYYATSDGGKEVALKYLRENPQVELRGVQHCLNLKSPHLVAIHDIKQSPEGEFFVIMEYVSGPSLRDLLNSEAEGLGAQKAAYFLREIGKGLAYLHDRGIVHRDLKPGNIFYEDGYVKIGDYGLAKIMAASQHSGQTVSVGTVHYMAPEVGSGNYDRTIDIYALGVMLYEMLLGKVPFSGATMGEVLMKHLTAQPVVDELPAPFPNVIRKALAKDPKDRYQTVQEMVGELFEVGDLERSVAQFEPASMTQLAAKAAAFVKPAGPNQGGVAVLGAGSSNVGQGIAPPVVNPTLGLGGVDRIHSRLQGGLDRIADRIDRAALGRRLVVGAEEHIKVIAGTDVSGRNRQVETIARAATMAALGSLAIGFIAEPKHGLQAAAGALAMMAAIVAGVVVGAYLSLEKLKAQSPYTPRFIIAALTTFWSALALTAGRIGQRGHVEQWFLAVAIIMLLSDWITRFHDGRRGVVSGGKAFKVGLLAFIVAGCLECNVQLMGFSVLGASLLVQIIAGAWPYAAAATQAAGGRAVSANPGKPVVEVSRDRVGRPTPNAIPTAPGPAVVVSRSGDTTDGRDATQELATDVSRVPAPELQRSSRARATWLIVSIPIIIVSVVFFFAAGILSAEDDRTLGLLCMGGVMTASLALFTLTRTLSAVKRGVYRELVRPGIFFISAGCAGCCGIGLGLLSGNSDRSMFPWVVGIVAFGLTALSIWLIPVAPWQPPPRSPEETARRLRTSGRWMIGLGIACFCWIAMSAPVLASVLSDRMEAIVIPAAEVPVLACGITLVAWGCTRTARVRQLERKARLTLPLRRSFETDSTKDLDQIVQRYFLSVGYKLASRENLLWTFTRGQWHGQFWQEDIRQWRTTLNVAAYEIYDGGGRVTCYVDVDRKFGEPKVDQLAVLNAELDELRDVLEADDLLSKD